MGMCDSLQGRSIDGHARQASKQASKREGHVIWKRIRSGGGEVADERCLLTWKGNLLLKG